MQNNTVKEQDYIQHTSNLMHLVKSLTQDYLSLWWASDGDLPVLGPKFTTKDKLAKERALDQFLNRLNHDLAKVPATESERQPWREEISSYIKQFARDLLEWPEECLEILFAEGFQAVTNEFVGQARNFNPAIVTEDIFQAIRNVWIANSLQLLFKEDLRLSPGIFGYSMLYPYSDNYLDDPAYSEEEKRAFNARFAESLTGQSVTPANTHEQAIFDLIHIIESQYPRKSYPEVYESLLAIHRAQCKSLNQQHGQRSPYESDIVGISVEKGGTSVLADGFLAKGSLTYEEASFAFGYGVFLQLIDDLQDVQEDRRNGHMTIFAQTATHWHLDKVTNRLLNFMGNVLERAHLPASSELNANVNELKALIWHACVLRVIEDVAKDRKFFSREYIASIEEYSHFHFAYLKKLKKIEQKYTSLPNLVYVLPGSNALPFAAMQKRKHSNLLKR